MPVCSIRFNQMIRHRLICICKKCGIVRTIWPWQRKCLSPNSNESINKQFCISFIRHKNNFFFQFWIKSQKLPFENKSKQKKSNDSPKRRNTSWTKSLFVGIFTPFLCSIFPHLFLKTNSFIYIIFFAKFIRVFYDKANLFRMLNVIFDEMRLDLLATYAFFLN